MTRMRLAGGGLLSQEEKEIHKGEMKLGWDRTHNQRENEREGEKDRQNTRREMNWVKRLHEEECICPQQKPVTNVKEHKSKEQNKARRQESCAERDGRRLLGECGKPLCHQH